MPARAGAWGARECGCGCVDNAPAAPQARRPVHLVSRYTQPPLPLLVRRSADQAATARVPPAQHQLLLAIRGHPDPAGPTIRDVAGYLLVRHHSAVELVDRAVAAGLVQRRQDGDDLRAVRLCCTADGADRLARLSALHSRELRRFAPQLEALWDGLDSPL